MRIEREANRTNGFQMETGRSNTMKAILIPVSGDMSVIEVDGWQSMAAAINAESIERVRVYDNPNRAMVVDEVGVLRGLAVNPRASVLYGTRLHHGVIRGDVLYLAEGFIDGEDPGVDFIDLKNPADSLGALNTRFQREGVQ